MKPCLLGKGLLIDELFKKCDGLQVLTRALKAMGEIEQGDFVLWIQLEQIHVQFDRLVMSAQQLLLIGHQHQDLFRKLMPWIGLAV